ncbi:MAG: Galactose-1-phosphate uridylyltransferase [uncultured bacterium]|nr:MAG: Galactose-1-phosphate uridylyltransferase [uncultured bacterium]
MSNYISDSSKTHWMVSNPARTTRTGMDGKPFRCPFCLGNEADTPPEVYRIGDGEINKPGWQVRVFANLFPITEIHEVVVHSPDHEKNIEDFPLVQVENILKTYISRFNTLSEKGKVFIFHNYALISGASLVHPHSQITVVPNEIPTVTLPVQPVVNIVEQVGEFVSYCPDYSEWSYEVWIRISEEGLGTRRLGTSFKNLNEKQISNLAKILKSTIQKLKKIYGSNPHYSKRAFGYNYYIYTPQAGSTGSPTGSGMTKQNNANGQNIVIPAEAGIQNSGNNWYLRIIPRFMERAGFELSTGIMVNSVEAKRASEELRKML